MSHSRPLSLGHRCEQFDRGGCARVLAGSVGLKHFDCPRGIVHSVKECDEGLSELDRELERRRVGLGVTLDASLVERTNHAAARPSRGLTRRLASPSPQWPGVAEHAEERHGAHPQPHHPALGKLQLSQLGAEHVESFMQAMKKKRLSPRTIMHLRGILRRALNRALRHDLVIRNVVTLADLPDEPARYVPKFLDVDEARAFLLAVSGDARGAVGPRPDDRLASR